MKNTVTNDLGKRLFIELGTHLQLEIKGIQLSLKAELIGMEVGKFLIVKMHQLDKTTTEQLEENVIIVTYLQKDAILGFQSSVISIITTPGDLVFIKYPESIENYNMRAHQRFECFLPAKFDIGHNIVEGAIINISNKGCCCKIKNLEIINEKKLDKITIFFQSSEMKSPLSVLGEVRSIRHLKDESDIGVIFDKMDSNTQIIMQNLIPDLGFDDKITKSY
ncbi:MAG: PilZ domain-containing protein [Candidatus Anammoxibacter sp.]